MNTMVGTTHIDGHNAAPDHKPRTVPLYYHSDTLAAIHWETDYDNYLCEQADRDEQAGETKL